MCILGGHSLQNQCFSSAVLQPRFVAEDAGFEAHQAWVQRPGLLMLWTHGHLEEKQIGAGTC